MAVLLDYTLLLGSLKDQEENLIVVKRGHREEKKEEKTYRNISKGSSFRTETQTTKQQKHDKQKIAAASILSIGGYTLHKGLLQPWLVRGGITHHPHILGVSSVAIFAPRLPVAQLVKGSFKYVLRSHFPS